MSTAVERLIVAEDLPADYRTVVDEHWRPLSEDIAERYEGRPLVVGINGSQGSGKTTLCRFLEALLLEHNQRAVTISLDDIYLTSSERTALAKSCHPLFMTRGVPGTHDVALGQAILDSLVDGLPVDIPRFDKAIDDRAAEVTEILTRNDIVLLEGWCVGAVPQPQAALVAPANRLEAQEDADGTWRREVNRRLATDYAEIFDRIDVLVMLEVEGFETVRAHRRRQEQRLLARHPDGTAVMDDAALDRFLMHFERLTRWMLEEMPARTDILIGIGEDQRPI